MILAHEESKTFLKTQMDGLTGNIEVIKYPFDRVEWGQEDYTGENVYCPWGHLWWPYEQTGYWVDGFTRCAILLRDKKAIKRARTIIYNVFNRADEDGYLGPKFLKEVETPYTRWSHVVFFRAAMAFYEYNKDKRILEKLTRHYLGYRVNYSEGRNVFNVEIMLWLYKQTGNKELLTLAEETYIQYNQWAKRRARFNYCTDSFALSNKLPTNAQGDKGAHGVNFNEFTKLGALLYLHTGKQKYLNASISAYKKIDEHYMLIDGLHDSAEELISNTVDRHHETCNITDFTWSQNYMFEATGNTEYLDKIEKCIWNAGLGAVTEDFKAAQYFSCVNQVVLDHDAWTCRWRRGAGYKPASYVECCMGNVNRFMPNYILNSWKEQGDNVYLKLFTSSLFKTRNITIEEQTNFPYENAIKLKVKTTKPFVLHLRLPKWNEGYRVSVNGQEIQTNVENGFILLPIEQDCSIDYEIRCSIIKHEDKDYVWFSKGAMVYTHKVRSLYKIDKCDERSSAKLPSYNIYPIEKWNYGIADGDTVIEQDGKLFVKAYEVENWQLETFGYKTKLPVPPTSPVVKNPYSELIELTPYGLSEARITAFAKINKNLLPS